MATQYAPIAKDSSINTTEQTPRNVADVLAQGLDAIEQAISGGGGSGSVILTSVISCATIVNNNYYGDLVTPSGYTALGILSIVSKNFTRSTGIIDYRIENNQVRIRVVDSGYQGSFDVVVLFARVS